MKTATYRKLGGGTFDVEYDPNAPCICCGEPVVDASMGGTVVCPWCDMGCDRTGNKVYRPYGPGKPHPKYLEHHELTLDEYLEASRG